MYVCMYVCVCMATGGLSGDHIESASPADPSFWVIHPTLERLLHAKLLSGGFADESWAADQIDDFVCSNHGLCAMNDSGRRVGTVDGGVQFFIYVCNVCMYVCGQAYWSTTRSAATATTRTPDCSTHSRDRSSISTDQPTRRWVHCPT